MWVRFREENILEKCIEDAQKSVYKAIEAKRVNKGGQWDARFQHWTARVTSSGGENVGRAAYPYLHKRVHSTVGSLKVNHETKYANKLQQIQQSLQKAVQTALARSKNGNVFIHSLKIEISLNLLKIFMK